MHTPRSTLARTSGNAGAALVPLYEVHKRFVLSCHVLHADETTVSMPDLGADSITLRYDASAMLQRGTDQVVVGLGRAECGVGGERHVGQRG